MKAKRERRKNGRERKGGGREKKRRRINCTAQARDEEKGVK